MSRPALVTGVALLVAGIIAVVIGLIAGASKTDEASASPTPTATPSPAPSSSSPSASPTSSANPSPSGTPKKVELRIPSIDVELPLTGAGVGSSGRISPPEGTATWVLGYDRVAPSQRGTAVIAGHLTANGKPDVFADLRKVKLGQEITVLADGAEVRYVVKRVDTADKKAVTTDQEVWGANDSTRRVVLITCDDELGRRADGHRVANYIVVADAD